MVTKKTHQRAWLKEILEVLGSMRFAIYLLMIVCVASAIGTLLEQNREEIFYIDRFGTYWYQVFSLFRVNQIYNAPWFLVVMAFLVVSTSLCLIRNVPKILKDIRSFKEYVRQTSLRAFPHKIDIHSAYSAEQVRQLSNVWLKKHGYAFKEKTDEKTHLLAAKKGSSNRLGYIFAHLAIVVICVGGLLDSELPNRLQIWLGHKAPIPSDIQYVAQVPHYAKFSPNNLSFRGNMSMSEGDTVNYALVNLGEDSYLQELPFSVKLNRFIIEYYQTNGMPKRFASDVTITDFATGKTENKIIEVNHPYEIHGVTLYQSSFNDGGSKVKLMAFPVKGQAISSQELDTRVGSVNEFTTRVAGKEQTYRLQVNDFRPINVEDLNQANPEKKLQEQFVALTGSANHKQEKKLHNVGPLIRYTLIDESNQAIEYQNYMLPVMLNERLVYLVGMKLPTDTGFSYMRIPMDEKGGMEEFFALRAALDDPALRLKAAKAYAEKKQDSQIDPNNIVVLADRALTIFAQRGFKGLEDYVEGVGVPENERVPEHIRGPMKNILYDYLIFSTIELRNFARQAIGWHALNYVGEIDAEKQAQWFDTAVRALSDMAYYPAPAVFHLRSFEQIQGSVIQATKSPGKWMVYLGCLFLIIGVFQMFYIRERRLWIWINALEDGCEIKAAMTSQKRTLEFQQEFEQFQQDFNELERKEHV